MRPELAERLLGSLMSWDAERFALEVPRLQTMAELKYDEYGGYRAGVRFAENLARWLEQFETEERETAYEFVMAHLVFISDAELTHLVEVAYPDFIEPLLLTRAAIECGVAPHRVEEVARSQEFAALRRSSLFLGMSDGARLDRLRRSSPLSHEQFGQNLEVDPDQATKLQAQLTNALQVQGLPGPSIFRQVFLVDDFSGSGRTMIRSDDEGSFKGKLWAFNERLKSLAEEGFFSSDAAVDILLYCASEQAVEQITTECANAGLGSWRVQVIQLIPKSVQVTLTAPPMAELCRQYYDPSTKDIHKSDTPLGFSDCALPVVLSHNTPNNSVCLLWAETPEEGLGRRALFPRYERHHRDRP